MCLAVPMELTDVRTGGRGTARADGIVRDVDISLIDDPRTGEFVIVHAGFAIERLDRAEAEARIALFEDMARRVSTPEFAS
ncbi:MAG: HypC/HybG/HupF family hydrogenase formation chaperone [Lentisphaerae bacterium]|nr:HypC/HybG/HupF family hydrogenase formation chaperone [Lentisphaerota bacterium]